jgi:hypothetical protein
MRSNSDPLIGFKKKRLDKEIIPANNAEPIVAIFNPLFIFSF